MRPNRQHGTTRILLVFDNEHAVLESGNYCPAAEETLGDLFHGRNDMLPTPFDFANGILLAKLSSSQSPLRKNCAHQFLQFARRLLDLAMLAVA